VSRKEYDDVKKGQRCNSSFIDGQNRTQSWQKVQFGQFCRFSHLFIVESKSSTKRLLRNLLRAENSDLHKKTRMKTVTEGLTGRGKKHHLQGKKSFL
jgi:hypothetical protein